VHCHSKQLFVKGKQELVVKVWDGTNNDEQPRGKQVSSPSGIWNTPVTGIWQSVWLEPVADVYVEDYNCVWAPENGQSIKVTLKEGGDGWDVEKGKQGAVVASVSAAPSGAPIAIHVPEPILWSSESPYLYALEISALKNGKVEVNGLMTYDRKVTKVDIEKRREVNLKVRNSL